MIGPLIIIFGWFRDSSFCLRSSVFIVSKLSRTAIDPIRFKKRCFRCSGMTG